MNNRPLLKFLLRVAGAFVLLSVLFHFAGGAYVRAVLPLVETTMQWAHPDWLDLSVNVGDRRGEQAVVLKAGVPAGTYMQGTKKMLRVKRTENAVDPAILITQPVIVLALLIGWPFLTVSRKLRALFIAVPCLLIVSTADMAVRLTEFAAQGVNTGGGLGAYFNYFMSNGGRQFTAVLVFLVSIAPFHLDWAALKPEKKAEPKAKPAHNAAQKKKKKKRKK